MTFFHYTFVFWALFIQAHCSVLSPKAGTFWHISDLHLDQYYSPTNGCPSSTGAPAINPGKWGDYKCDSPFTLINSTLHAMKEFKKNPDFILWTGDNILHTNEKKKYLSTRIVIETERKLAELIKDVFPTTVVYGVLGNHDFFPADHMPSSPNDVVESVASIWSHWMSKEQVEVFKKYGYYHEFPAASKGNLCIALLNTNHWDYWNPNVNGTGDPAMQFEWLEKLLTNARRSGYKKILICCVFL